MRDDRDEFDRLLDAALDRYGDPGADSGLEQRILSRIVGEEAPAPRRRWLWWAIALPAAGVLLIFVMLFRPGLKRPPSAGSQQTNLHKQPATPSIDAANDRGLRQPSIVRSGGTSLRKSHMRDEVLADASAPLPKLAVFPTPDPPTRHERALAEYVARMPQAELQALAKAQQYEFAFSRVSLHSFSIASVPTLKVEPIPTLPFESPDEVSLGPRTQDEN